MLSQEDFEGVLVTEAILTPKFELGDTLNYI